MQNVGLLIADEVQIVGGDVGPTYEVIISRTRYVSSETGIKTRIVALGVSLANAEVFRNWIGAEPHNTFNFSPRFVCFSLICFPQELTKFELQRSPSRHRH